VTAEVTKEPDVTSSKEGRTSTATLEGEVTYTFKYNGKPMADAQIHEDVSNKSFQDGKQVSVVPTTQDAPTHKDGTVVDQGSSDARSGCTRNWMLCRSCDGKPDRR
jgi:hypothetical protein